MKEDLIRALFSMLAATVTLTMSAEFASDVVQKGDYWKIGPATILAAFAVLEAHKVYTRLDAVLGLLLIGSR